MSWYSHIHLTCRGLRERERIWVFCLLGLEWSLPNLSVSRLNPAVCEQIVIYSPASYLAETIPSHVRFRIIYPCTHAHVTCLSLAVCFTSSYRSVSLCLKMCMVMWSDHHSHTSSVRGRKQHTKLFREACFCKKPLLGVTLQCDLWLLWVKTKVFAQNEECLKDCKCNVHLLCVNQKNGSLNTSTCLYFLSPQHIFSIRSFFPTFFYYINENSFSADTRHPLLYPCVCFHFKK